MIIIIIVVVVVVVVTVVVVVVVVVVEVVVVIVVTSSSGSSSSSSSSSIDSSSSSGSSNSSSSSIGGGGGGGSSSSSLPLIRLALLPEKWFAAITCSRAEKSLFIQKNKKTIITTLNTSRFRPTISTENAFNVPTDHGQIPNRAVSESSSERLNVRALY